MIVEVFDIKKQQKVYAGEFFPISNVFVKVVKPAHYMVKEQAYGFQDALIPIPVFACGKCGHVNKEFLPALS